ncbi:MAG: hypothetical protein KZQ66_18980 [Candidatus Thiodiazotropha sp. (ex Lucinoma aequizonata)]|nr:hypothetical protein [Candidatus Thiodiazotropha sp. (ex Lucinoma aequizonata)]MCU7888770.1 hypothetical protein [Candidatus Thiodiazotropha sp. (ex Lucinoma aequizonata)]MCU7895275.1 hypothetical protein [Candidatus Thiodiazotropha sp. (ex Lucinoma aequizonata)]MCU7898402.1 hypothetical protein [Candidatus Thiodiazotropha sp. (ex Lucinoma aequizonata)]MCU7903802.1 hypothetical protein [Candidatus Thiodiazotropha sp. (ex Lucinoma aequizonata)]
MMKHAEEIERIINTVGKTLETPLSPTQRSRLHQALIKSLDETPNGDNKPQNKQVTILLSDLRGFTSLTERYPANTIIKILNFYNFHACAKLL